MASTVKKAVALLSGGLDSSVACLLAQTYDCDIVETITFDYGQRAAAREILQAQRVASYLGLSHRVISLPWFKEFRAAGSLLSRQTDLPRPTLRQLDEKPFTRESAKAVWVPNRNGTFIEIAAGIAEDKGAGVVIVGFNQEEAATFPDNSSEYVIAISYALNFSTSNRVQVLSPTSRLDKTAIVREAIQHKLPIDLLWSCYEGGEKMCGTCESCTRLKRALAKNQISHEALFENTDLR